MTDYQARLASKLAEGERGEGGEGPSTMPPSPYAAIQDEEGPRAARGPQFFAAFTATMGSEQQRPA
jgi:hypothetical protein